MLRIEAVVLLCLLLSAAYSSKILHCSFLFLLFLYPVFDSFCSLCRLVLYFCHFGKLTKQGYKTNRISQAFRQTVQKASTRTLFHALISRLMMQSLPGLSKDVEMLWYCFGPNLKLNYSLILLLKVCPICPMWNTPCWLC